MDKNKKEKYFYWNKEVSVERYTLLRSFLRIQGEKKSLFINKTGEEIILLLLLILVRKEFEERRVLIL